jgi:hypothetical protein
MANYYNLPRLCDLTVFGRSAGKVLQHPRHRPWSIERVTMAGIYDEDLLLNYTANLRQLSLNLRRQCLPKDPYSEHALTTGQLNGPPTWKDAWTMLHSFKD